MRHPVLRYGAAALCVLGAVYFLLPLSMGVLHIGMLYPAAGLLLAAVWLVFPGLFRQWPRWLRRTVCVVLAAGVLTFCTLNYTHYGVFALSDFSEGSFAAAMGAMMRVDTDSDKPYLSVPADARAKIYAAVPELEPLAYWLEEDDQLQNDFRDPGLDDYRAGSFYWAIRRAAQFEGCLLYTSDAADE